VPLPHTRHRYRVVASVAAPCQEYVIGHSGCQDFVLTFSQSSRSNECGQLVRLPGWLRASPLGERVSLAEMHVLPTGDRVAARSKSVRYVSRSEPVMAALAFGVTGSGSIDEIEVSRTAQPRIGKRNGAVSAD
jgi:hypothetical protein